MKRKFLTANFKMKKSIFWLIIAIISLIFAIHNALTCNIIQAILGCTICCSSLVIGAWYEREEREQKENH